MAHTEHAKKTHRKSLKRRAANRATKSTLRSSLKAARSSLGSDAATGRVASASALLDKAAKNRVIHPNKAARLKSRLAKAANKAKAAK